MGPNGPAIIQKIFSPGGDFGWVPSKDAPTPAQREYTPVDPNSYLHADTVENRLNFKAAHGGHVSVRGIGSYKGKKK